MECRDITLDKLEQRFISDLNKPKINILDKAILVRRHLDKNNFTFKQYAERYGSSKTNVHELLLPLSLTKEQQDSITEDTILADVYTMLGKDRLKKKKSKVSLEDSVNELDESLNDAIGVFEGFIGKFPIDNNVSNKIIVLKNVLNKLLDS